MSFGDSLRATLAKYVPTWLANLPGLRNLYSIAWTIALQGDVMRRWAIEGKYATLPGVGTPTALPYIGASRGLIQGPSEPNSVFAARCIAWLSVLPDMGHGRGLVKQIQAYLIGQGSLGAGMYPVVSFVSRNGDMVTANADTTLTESVVSWDWDDLGGWVDETGWNNPGIVEGWWSDGWLLIQDPYTHYTGFSDPNWLSAWNSGDQTVDSICPQQVVADIQTIVDVWKGAHDYIRCIVWVPIPTSFTPTGWYGNWSSNQSGTQAARRNGAYSYWQPVRGA